MPPTQPNVIFFFTDQQRWDTTGAHGNPLGLTPNFDRMAHEGAWLYNSFTCQPVCAPARACLQTGQYATRCGVWRNGIGLPDAAGLPTGQPSLAGEFKKAGYQTAYIGKWHLYADSEGPVPAAHRAGYDFWLGSNLLEFTSYPYRTTLYDNDDRPVRLPGYRVDALTDAAIRYIDSHQAAPFFLFLSYLEPHHQNQVDAYPAPDGYADMYNGRWLPPDLAALGGSAHQHAAGYFGQVKRLDEALGRLRDALKSLDLLDNTIILFTSDHGSHFKTRNGEYKRSCHESAVRVPTAICGPGFDGGGTLKQLVTTVDLPATLLDAAGLPIPAGFQGRSVLPLVRREAVDWPEEVFIQISESQVGRAVRTRRWKYSVSAPDKSGWQDSASDVYVEEFLYDLENDPYEFTNLIHQESHREVARALRARLVRRMLEAGESAPTIQEVERRPSGQRRVLEHEIDQ